MLSLTRKLGEAFLIVEGNAVYGEEFQGTKRSCFSKRCSTSLFRERRRTTESNKKISGET